MKFFRKKYYSFGISTENQGRVLNSGLIQQRNDGRRELVLTFTQFLLDVILYLTINLND
jgi:hypothetical protein